MTDRGTRISSMTVGGQEVDPSVVDGLNRRMGMVQQQEQLSFDVGGQIPDVGVLKVGGQLMVGTDVSKGTEVHIVVSGMDGEVIANGYGHVVGVAFKDVYKDGDIVGTERIHAVKVT